MKKTIFALLAVLCFSTSAEIRSAHCPLNCPSLEITTNDVVFNYTYALSNNSMTKFADWVAYEVNVLNFGDSPARTWRNDPLIESDETLEDKDYKDAHDELETDRGHQAPLASFAGSRHWRELNYLSNITPQKTALNQGSWKELEMAVRDAVGYRNSLYVITGALYLETERELPEADEPHKVPSAYYKVIYDLNGNAASFIFDQDLPRNTNYCSQKKTYQQVKAKLSFTMPTLFDSAEVLKRLGC